MYFNLFFFFFCWVEKYFSISDSLLVPSLSPRHREFPNPFYLSSINQREEHPTQARILWCFLREHTELLNPTPMFTYLHPPINSRFLDRFSVQPLTVLGVTGPFSVLAENIYSLCVNSFNVSL